MIEDLGVGAISERDLDRFARLQALLHGENTGVRYLDYRQCEAAAETLAARLIEKVGGENLDGFVFAPLPRGGLIVLGMLSYLLGLRHSQLTAAPDDDRPVVLVDDVAMTGARLRQRIDELTGREVVVAHLASPPELREAVEEEENVTACVAALDLAALDDRLGPEERDRLRATWAERLLGERYWHGYAELVAFPWTEPDSIIWNPETSQTETGWRLVSPERSLKNRAALGPPSVDREAREFRFPIGIAHGRFDDGYLVCRLDTEEVFRLDGAAAAIWGALGTLGDVEAAARHLAAGGADAYPTEAVAGFAEELVRAGLLERHQTRP